MAEEELLHRVKEIYDFTTLQHLFHFGIKTALIRREEFYLYLRDYTPRKGGDVPYTVYLGQMDLKFVDGCVRKIANVGISRARGIIIYRSVMFALGDKHAKK